VILFNLCLDCFWVEHSVVCLLPRNYWIKVNNSDAQFFCPDVCENLAVENEMRETDVTLSNVGRTDPIKNEILH